MELKTDVPFTPTVKRLAEIAPSDLGGRPIVDIKLPAFSSVFAANDQGMVYTYDLAVAKATLCAHHIFNGIQGTKLSTEFSTMLNLSPCPK